MKISRISKKFVEIFFIWSAFEDSEQNKENFYILNLKAVLKFCLYEFITDLYSSFIHKVNDVYHFITETRFNPIKASSIKLKLQR